MKKLINRILHLPKRIVSGFTLLELLVVISIIGLMATLLMVAITEVRSQARDAARMSDVRQIALALELYYLDHGNYPIEGDDLGGLNNGFIGVGGPIDALLEPYIGKVPNDPLYDGSDPANKFFYYYDGYHQCRFKASLNNNILEAVVFANKLENVDRANRDTLCIYNDHEQSQTSPGSPAFYYILSDFQPISL